MTPKKSVITLLLVAILAAMQLSHARQNGRPSTGTGESATESTSSQSESNSATLDFNEATHMIFMREEEKLARDVYTKLGTLYPDSVVFGRIDNSEQQHTDAVKNLLASYGIADPNTNDNVGMFTGAAYGDYFTEKYEYLTNLAKSSEMDALYVGAFIEELDMLDIVQCPKVIVEQDNGIDDIASCGLAYTDQKDIRNVYESLLDGSKSHLRAYVRAIESVIGKGGYTAQVLPQEEVDEILGR
ncbi:MAG: DUF2202 domain-containing protein [Candidatus Thiodiazotropha sp. (ex Monitilora ramsayi)]|nr:DUF2202 domain-containing protein [Candidatus Thiodiazotropha sp. (ex Monitilora ramsayi)]